MDSKQMLAYRHTHIRMYAYIYRCTHVHTGESVYIYKHPIIVLSCLLNINKCNMPSNFCQENNTGNISIDYYGLLP